jgi:hypothetical protein
MESVIVVCSVVANPGEAQWRRRLLGRNDSCCSQHLWSAGRAHYQKQSLHRELEASARAKSPALGEAPLRREHKVWLSAKDWPTVNSTFAESFLPSALGERFGWRLRSRSRHGRLRPLNSPRAWRFGSRRRKNTRRRNTFTESIIPSVSVLFLPTANFQKKFTFSSPNFFLDPHTLEQYTCSKLAPFCLC